MDKKIGLFWLRDDFRLTKNNGLIEATTNHDHVVVFYLYKKDTYKPRGSKMVAQQITIKFQKTIN